MNCEILRTLYIKSNGEILCNDDAGERISLGAVSEAGPSTGIFKILFNERYEHIRTSLKRGQTPWKGVCDKCAFLRPDEPFSNDALDMRVIDKLQIEASLACALKCPMCANSDQIRNRNGNIHFSQKLLRGVLCELKDNGYLVKCVEYCGQGEPLNHPHFPQLVNACREIYPEAFQRLITNGNHEYRRRIGDAFLDEIIVSIDGARQESYEQYRVRGKIDKCLTFLRDAVDLGGNRGSLVIWKYILFETNDSDEEILEAQRLSRKIGVTQLLFVHSHTNNKSLRYTIENPYSIPVLYPNVTVNSHPSYYKRAIMLHPTESPALVSGGKSLMHVDQIIYVRNKYLSFAGWAVSLRDISNIAVEINGVKLGRFPLGGHRSDVLRALPEFGQVNSGFNFFCKDALDGSRNGAMIRFCLHDVEAEIATFALEVDLQARSCSSTLLRESSTPSPIDGRGL